MNRENLQKANSLVREVDTIDSILTTISTLKEFSENKKSAPKLEFEIYGIVLRVQCYDPEFVNLFDKFLKQVEETYKKKQKRLDDEFKKL